MRKIKRKQTGFTLVEILTTIAIIAILIGLLIPALNMVQSFATNVKQKAQFSAIGTALEAFSTDIGDYPLSSRTDGSGAIYCGAQRLAEAIIGQDGFGFHPSSLWRADGLADMNGDGTISEAVYHIGTDEVYETKEQNRTARKGPYLELEHANAVQVQYIYPAVGPLTPANYVLVDMFNTVKHRRTQKRTGMPILYYKADTSQTGNDGSTFWAVSAPCTNVYNIYDNWPFVATLAHPATGQNHPQRDFDAATGYGIFYNRIANPNFTNPVRPYRSQSFILQSAGPDGLYGTADDVFNIDENEK